MRLAGPFSGSPVAADHYLYIANERGDLQVVDLAGAEGKVVTTVPLEETILATPALLTAAKTDSRPTVGQGDYVYSVDHHWAQLPERYTWQTTHNVAIDSNG